jgi:hypothetical protein
MSYSLVFNLNSKNNYQTEIILNQAAPTFKFVALAASEYFAIESNISAYGSIVLFNSDNTFTNISVNGLLSTQPNTRALVINQHLESIKIKLVIPRSPRPEDSYEGIIIFYP